MPSLDRQRRVRGLVVRLRLLHAALWPFARPEQRDLARRYVTEWRDGG